MRDYSPDMRRMMIVDTAKAGGAGAESSAETETQREQRLKLKFTKIKNAYLYTLKGQILNLKPIELGINIPGLDSNSPQSINLTDVRKYNESDSVLFTVPGIDLSEHFGIPSNLSSRFDVFQKALFSKPELAAAFNTYAINQIAAEPEADRKYLLDMLSKIG